MRVSCRRNGIRQNGDARRAQVDVVGIECSLIERSEPVEDRSGGTQLNSGVTEVLVSVVCAVASRDINIASSIDSGASAAAPYATSDRSGGSRCIGERSGPLLSQSRRVIGHHPTVIGDVIAVRAEGDVERAVSQSQRRPLQVPEGSEVWSGDDQGAAKFFGSGHQ